MSERISVSDEWLGLKSGNIALCIQKIEMLKNIGDPMDALELAEKAKKQNIIDMAVGFTAMMPLFQERSADLIKEKLVDLSSCDPKTGVPMETLLKDLLLIFGVATGVLLLCHRLYLAMTVGLLVMGSPLFSRSD